MSLVAKPVLQAGAPLRSRRNRLELPDVEPSGRARVCSARAARRAPGKETSYRPALPGAAGGAASLPAASPAHGLRRERILGLRTGARPPRGLRCDRRHEEARRARNRHAPLLLPDALAA